MAAIHLMVAIFYNTLCFYCTSVFRANCQLLINALYQRSFYSHPSQLPYGKSFSVAFLLFKNIPSILWRNTVCYARHL